MIELKSTWTSCVKLIGLEIEIVFLLLLELGDEVKELLLSPGREELEELLLNKFLKIFPREEDEVEVGVAEFGAFLEREELVGFMRGTAAAEEDCVGESKTLDLLLPPLLLLLLLLLVLVRNGGATTGYDFKTSLNVLLLPALMLSESCSLAANPVVPLMLVLLELFALLFLSSADEIV